MQLVLATKKQTFGSCMMVASTIFPSQGITISMSSCGGLDAPDLFHGLHTLQPAIHVPSPFGDILNHSFMKRLSRLRGSHCTNLRLFSRYHQHTYYL
ncbi:hypothetical protein AVEN_171210-1 [Araneus ventricosus]|uniref:Uncharacterized protein n=1 Tax=Araneus ventricosus TaxID=182803 RepID=A0A4Y2HG93_ARAVE|nr:hypothetical protein AVEN_275457-1 [Araneus ventricosus]GBM64341.1 hypothetical protein AVEN_171210-1 [Araneus ventricosus]